MPSDIREPEIDAEPDAAIAAEPAPATGSGLLSASGPEAEAEAEPEATAELATAADQAADAVTATQQEALESIETAGAAVLAGAGAVQREIAGFVAERIRSDFDAQAALLRCRSFSELRSVQTEFLRTAYDQYASEATRLVRLGGAMVTRSLERAPH